MADLLSFEKPCPVCSKIDLTIGWGGVLFDGGKLIKELVSQLKQKWFFLAAWIAFVWASQWITVGFPLGDNMLYFACWAVVLPLIGNFMNATHGGLLTGLMWLLYYIPFSFPITLASLPITMGIPTLFATFSWRVSKQPKKAGHFLVHCALPLLCMLFFYLSPVGGGWVYSLYWLIPIALYLLSLVRPGLLFERALQSTFIAHALGSVIWAYFIPMAPSDWIDLIPVVALERLLMAGFGATVCFVLEKVYCQNFKFTSLSFQRKIAGI